VILITAQSGKSGSSALQNQTMNIPRDTSMPAG
jgi:hypothetical protein